MGNGQTMAIFGWGVTDPVVPDLRSFEAEWGLPGVPISLKKYGSSSTPDTSGDGATGEWELDGRREDAQTRAMSRIRGREHEDRLGMIELAGDRLHRVGVETICTYSEATSLNRPGRSTSC